MKRALVILSGGQDSSTCLALALREYPEVAALTFDYGQRHVREVDAAKEMVAYAAKELRRTIMHEVVELPQGILRGTSPLVDPQRSVELYSGAEALPGGLEKTFVPMRNMMFLTVAANRAVCMAASPSDTIDIITGVSQEDYGGYPDCRGSFIESMQDAVAESLDDPDLPLVRVVTPLLHLTKKQTVELAESLPLGRALNALSHTCYNGEFPPCGKCHACLLRAKGYAEAGVEDPLIAAATA